MPPYLHTQFKGISSSRRLVCRERAAVSRAYGCGHMLFNRFGGWLAYVPATSPRIYPWVLTGGLAEPALARSGGLFLYGALPADFVVKAPRMPQEPSRGPTPLTRGRSPLLAQPRAADNGFRSPCLRPPWGDTEVLLATGLLVGIGHRRCAVRLLVQAVVQISEKLFHGDPSGAELDAARREHRRAPLAWFGQLPGARAFPGCGLDFEGLGIVAPLIPRALQRREVAGQRGRALLLIGAGEVALPLLALTALVHLAVVRRIVAVLHLD